MKKTTKILSLLTFSMAGSAVAGQAVLDVEGVIRINGETVIDNSGNWVGSLPNTRFRETEISCEEDDQALITAITNEYNHIGITAGNCEMPHRFYSNTFYSIYGSDGFIPALTVSNKSEKWAAITVDANTSLFFIDINITATNNNYEHLFDFDRNSFIRLNRSQIMGEGHNSCFRLSAASANISNSQIEGCETAIAAYDSSNIAVWDYSSSASGSKFSSISESVVLRHNSTAMLYNMEFEITGTDSGSWFNVNSGSSLKITNPIFSSSSNYDRLVDSSGSHISLKGVSSDNFVEGIILRSNSELELDDSDLFTHGVTILSDTNSSARVSDSRLESNEQAVQAAINSSVIIGGDSEVISQEAALVASTASTISLEDNSSVEGWVNAEKNAVIVTQVPPSNIGNASLNVSLNGIIHFNDEYINVNTSAWELECSGGIIDIDGAINLCED